MSANGHLEKGAGASNVKFMLVVHALLDHVRHKSSTRSGKPVYPFNLLHLRYVTSKMFWLYVAQNISAIAAGDYGKA